MKKVLFFLILSLWITDLSLAATGSGSLPWESPLGMIKDSLTGPVAVLISLIAIVVCGVALIFGGDFSGFVRSLINVVIVISIVLGSSSLITRLFGVSGALLREAPKVDSTSQTFPLGGKS